MLSRTLAGAAMTVAVMGVAATPAAAATTGSQSFTILSNNDHGPVLATGPISGHGRLQSLSDTQDRILFPGGSVLLTHATTSNNDSFNEQTCTVLIDESGTYRLTGESGVYAGATGTGTFHAFGLVSATKTASGCSDHARALVMVRATGTTTTP